ncbi:hypothetical protein GCM10010357_40260 [Streptomyces luteireticuli]|uniref:Uncharacterized protein n=1 Tax=Streptomyces luteireticuli TaxID=173858 RepID=A0ABN0YWP5_9ACTN
MAIDRGCICSRSWFLTCGQLQLRGQEEGRPVDEHRFGSHSGRPELAPGWLEIHEDLPADPAASQTTVPRPKQHPLPHDRIRAARAAVTVITRTVRRLSHGGRSRRILAAPSRLIAAERPTRQSFQRKVNIARIDLMTA